MSNLEELFLNISIGLSTPDKSFIDGNDLKRDIINHMPKLNKFVFSIHSNLDVDDLTHLPSNEDIQRTFKGLEDYQIISYIHYLPDDQIGQCHIYSQPYTMNYLYRLTNSFPSGLFKFVHNYPSEKFQRLKLIKISKSYGNNQNHKSNYSATKSRLKSIKIRYYQSVIIRGGQL
ncbi:unnamed protein product [Rotaria sp. Silwood2]|nr:unnamed protein product [Rotaria sp. Silwood2]